MPRSHVFHEIYLHINWHCHEDRPLLPPEREPIVHHLIQEYCRKCKGVFFHGIGGTATHVHLAVQVEPFVTPSDFIGKVKGAVAHEINQQFGPDSLQWQRGYGMVSFAAANLPAVLKYVQNQKAHHQSGGLKDKLEQTYVDFAEGEHVPEEEAVSAEE
jgi:putative transposase